MSAESLLAYEIVGEVPKDVLEKIFPSEQETPGNFRTISRQPASRVDAIELQKLLDQKLLARHARQGGICPVRQDLYGQAFNELIRQVAVNSPERGLLLMRVRDELRMTIDAYKTLYDSSVTFGMRKQLQASHGIEEMEVTTKKLEEEKSKLENEVLELRNRVDQLEKRAAESKKVTEKSRREQIDFLKYEGAHLNTFLKNIGGK
eukprot:TRINITY_DN821_c0_g1_i1.p2 TRINITY_DN821_c0_g1~~TRINITY_DN821_c0_g1_i1.p2  ORF type:complete len:205 (+),score=53.01 TRINITY_DN821_c0_g1_i1:1466-2080(+)